jgi:hypothetical protein
MRQGAWCALAAAEHTGTLLGVPGTRGRAEMLQRLPGIPHVFMMAVPLNHVDSPVSTHHHWLPDGHDQPMLHSALCLTEQLSDRLQDRLTA